MKDNLRKRAMNKKKIPQGKHPLEMDYQHTRNDTVEHDAVLFLLLHGVADQAAMLEGNGAVKRKWRWWKDKGHGPTEEYERRRYR